MYFKILTKKKEDELLIFHLRNMNELSFNKIKYTNKINLQIITIENILIDLIFFCVRIYEAKQLCVYF